MKNLFALLFLLLLSACSQQGLTSPATPSPASSVALEELDRSGWANAYSMDAQHPRVQLGWDDFADLKGKPLAALKRGSEYQGNARYQLAIEAYSESLGAAENEVAYFNRGRCYLQTGQYEKAKSDFEAFQKVSADPVALEEAERYLRFAKKR